MAEYKEYDNLLELLNKSDKETVYEKLLGKEEKVLDTVNRIIDHSNAQELKQKEFLNTPIKDIIRNLFLRMSSIILELQKASTFQDVKAIISKHDRQIYIGLFLIIVSVFLFFIAVSS
jgi:uncharacterized membrane protein YgcG